MSGNTDLLIQINRLEAIVNVAMRALEQIATTPRNRGARQNANGTLRFLQTQIESIKGIPND
jgi:hypothetical protein